MAVVEETAVGGESCIVSYRETWIQRLMLTDEETRVRPADAIADVEVVAERAEACDREKRGEPPHDPVLFTAVGHSGLQIRG